MTDTKKWSLYWAYGSNLSTKRMTWRCRDAVKLGPLTIPNARLVFRGVADVVYEYGHEATGGLWYVTEKDIEELDRFEGVKGGLYTKEYIKIRLNNEEHQVLLYQMNEEGILPPSQYYLALIAQGYKDFGLDISFLNDAVKHSKEHKNVTPLLKKRHFYSSYDDKKPEQNNRKLSKKERRMLRKQRARQIAQGTNHNTLPVPYSNYFYQHKPKNNYWKWMAEQQEKYEIKQKEHETKTFEPVEGAAYGGSPILCNCGHAVKYGTQCPHCWNIDIDKNFNDPLDNI